MKDSEAGSLDDDASLRPSSSLALPDAQHSDRLFAGEATREIRSPCLIDKEFHDDGGWI
jgi:hypothetical protein